MAESLPFGEQIKQLRMSQGLSQAALGELLGVSQSRVAQIENRPGSASFEQVLHTIRVLGADLVVRPARSRRLTVAVPEA